MMEPKQTLATKCFESIKESILAGKFLPGDKLHCEQLKSKLNVGMSPVREALAKLTATNLVTFEEHKGYTVKKMNADQLMDNILTFVELECLCFGLAIDYGDDNWEGSVISALHCLKKVESGQKVAFEQWTKQNEKFHNALVSACPFKALMDIRDEFYKRHQWYNRLTYLSTNSLEIQANHEEHERIANLAFEKKKEEAIHKLRLHMTLGKETLIDKLTTQGLLYGTG